MNKRSFLLSLAAGILACSIGVTDAGAGTVDVTAAEGTFAFTLTSSGQVSPGVYGVTIAYSDVLLVGVTPTGSGPPPPAVPSTFDTASILFTITSPPPPITVYATNEGLATKVFGTSTFMSATQMNTVNTGYAIGGFLNLVGTIKVAPNQLMEVTSGSQIYNWSTLNNGAISLTYNQVAADFAATIKNGGTITGTGGFTEAAVPEPASMALLGIGMTGLLAFRRFFKRNVVA
jgi:hypothetical protein